MKNFAITWSIPNVFVKINGQTKLVPSMVLSTLSACALITFLPQLMPLWIAWSTGSAV